MVQVGTTATVPLEKVGWRTRTRPETGLGHALGAAGGFFVVLSALALVYKISSTSTTWAGIGFSALLILAAFVAALLPAGPVRGAAVVTQLFATQLIWSFVFYGQNQRGFGWYRLVLLLSAALYFVFYALLWTRGRAIFLAFALLFVASYAQFEVHRQFESTAPNDAIESTRLNVIPPPLYRPAPLNRGPLSGFLQSAFVANPLQTRTGDDVAITALILGAGFIAAGGVLNRKGFAGAAVPFLVVGAIEGFAAASKLGPNEGNVSLGAGLAILVAVLLALGGAGGGRRGSVWIGGLSIAVAGAIMINDWAQQGHAVLSLAGFSIGAAALLIGLGTLTGRLLHEVHDGGGGGPG
jgi:hypothetical protein